MQRNQRYKSNAILCKDARGQLVRLYAYGAEFLCYLYSLAPHITRLYCILGRDSRGRLYIIPIKSAWQSAYQADSFSHSESLVILARDARGRICAVHPAQAPGAFQQYGVSADSYSAARARMLSSEVEDSQQSSLWQIHKNEVGGGAGYHVHRVGIYRDVTRVDSLNVTLLHWNKFSVDLASSYYWRCDAFPPDTDSYPPGDSRWTFMFSRTVPAYIGWYVEVVSLDAYVPLPMSGTLWICSVSQCDIDDAGWPSGDGLYMSIPYQLDPVNVSSSSS